MFKNKNIKQNANYAKRAGKQHKTDSQTKANEPKRVLDSTPPPPS